MTWNSLKISVPALALAVLASGLLAERLFRRLGLWDESIDVLFLITLFCFSIGLVFFLSLVVAVQMMWKRKWGRRPLHDPRAGDARGPGVKLTMKALGAAAKKDLSKIETIESELVNELDAEMAERLLAPFFECEDPWVKARAAKAIYRINTEVALGELKSLINDSYKESQMACIWALGELATPDALDILVPFAWDNDKEIQQAVIRCLIQVENRKRVPEETLEKVKGLLAELRTKTDWII
ncbi:MAG: HEAT repeat domain-containing protein [Elusimicrobia bacterium]|nr:HEAT repeat domain-containing protein [Elusimicrobiota bacterium]